MADGGNIQNDEIRCYDAVLFARHIINFIIPGNPASITSEEDTEFVRRVFDDDMRTTVGYLYRIYRIYTREMFIEIVQQNCVNMVFFDTYAASFRDNLFRRGVSYDRFLHFSVFLVCMAANFNRLGFFQAIHSTTDVINSTLLNRIPRYNIQEIHQIAQEYVYLNTDIEAREIEILDRLFPDPTGPFIQTPSRFDRIVESSWICEYNKKFLKIDEAIQLIQNEGMDNIVAGILIQNPSSILIVKYLLSRPRFRRRHISADNNLENRNSHIASPLMYYTPVPGTSLEYNPVVIHRIPYTEKHQFLPTTILPSRNSNTSPLIDYSSVSGTSRDTDPVIIDPIINTEGYQLLPTTSLHSRKRNTSPFIDYSSVPGTSRDSDPVLLHPISNTEEYQLPPTTIFRNTSPLIDYSSVPGTRETDPVLMHPIPYTEEYQLPPTTIFRNTSPLIDYSSVPGTRDSDPVVIDPIPNTEEHKFLPTTRLYSRKRKPSPLIDYSSAPGTSQDYNPVVIDPIPNTKEHPLLLTTILPLKKRNISSLIDYSSIPGTSRYSDQVVIDPIPNTEEHQLPPTTRLPLKKRIKHKLSESRTPKKAKCNTSDSYNQVMRYKTYEEKNTSHKNIESSSSSSE